VIDNPNIFRISGQQRSVPAASASWRRPCGASPEDYHWHVLGIVHRHYGSAENELAAAGWQVLFPLHLQRSRGNPERIVPLFGGYAFVRFHRDTDWGSLRRTRYVTDLLMAHPGHPSVLADAVVEDLRRRMSPRRIVDDPLHTPPPLYAPGTRLVVRTGGLAGLEGVCGMSAIGRISLLFRLLGHELSLDLATLDAVPV
jgi:hypothetical protein